MAHQTTIAALRQKYLTQETTPTKVVEEALTLIVKDDADIHAYLEVYEAAKAEAATATETFAREGNAAPVLCGIPIALKNNIMFTGHTTTAASKMLENYVATYDATIVKKLRAAGAIIIGATNMDEFAMGNSTENSAFGPTKNPCDPTRVPGGSSGGSAAAVAMGSVPAAIGTDTGGSVRQPASFCGLVGFKPTYGAVSRYGLIAMGSSFDQAGPLTNSVADAELLHTIMAGQDVNDMTTIAPDTYPEVATKDLYTIGIPRDFLATGVDPDVMERFEEQVAALTSAGHTIVDVSLPLYAKGLAAYYISIPAEVSSNLARYDGIRYGTQVAGENLLDGYEKSRAEGFGAEVKRRILLGTYVLSAGYYDAYYGKAEAMRELMREELRAVFETVDVLLTPTTPTPAFALGEITDPLTSYVQDIFTVPVNLTGVPAISLPMGTVTRNDISLPVGMQFVAPHGGDARLFDIATRTFDQRT